MSPSPFSATPAGFNDPFSCGLLRSAAFESHYLQALLERHDERHAWPIRSETSRGVLALGSQTAQPDLWSHGREIVQNFPATF
jgi:hypothetical protein